MAILIFSATLNTHLYVEELNKLALILKVAQRTCLINFTFNLKCVSYKQHIVNVFFLIQSEHLCFDWIIWLIYTLILFDIIRNTSLIEKFFCYLIFFVYYSSFILNWLLSKVDFNFIIFDYIFNFFKVVVLEFAK